MLYVRNYSNQPVFFKRFVWTAFLFLLSDLACFAQPGNYYFSRHITQEEGLLHNNVYDIVQDTKGFMWIATTNGLQRYDGSRFLTLRDMLNNPAQATPGSPALYMDVSNHALWITQTSNAEKLNLTNHQITFYQSDRLQQLLLAQSSKYWDAQGNSYLVSGKAIFRYNKLIKKYEPFSQNSKPFLYGASSEFVVDTANHQTWVGSYDNGLLLFDSKTKGVYSAAYNPIHHPILQAYQQQFSNKHIEIRRLMIDSRHNLWLATWEGRFCQFQAASGKFFSYSIPSILRGKVNKKDNTMPQTVSCFYEDNHHKIWIGAENTGLFIYDSTNNTFDLVSVNGNGQQNEPYNYNIYCIFQDREETIWLGTDKGITLFNPYRQYFQFIHHDRNSKSSLPKSEIQCYIQTHSGDILAGTWGGGITVYDSNWVFKRNIRFPSKPFELNLIWNFVQQDDGTIWVGCQHGYIHIYNQKDQSVHTIHPQVFENYTIRCVAKDKKGNLWFGLHNGKIAEWNKDEKRFYSYQDNLDKANNFRPVTFIFFDRQQRCWVSTEGGLKEFNTSKRVYIASYTNNSSGTQSIISNIAEGIEQFNDSILVIATVHGGLTLFSTRNKTFTRFTPGNNLDFSNTYAVKKDATGNLWFTTDYGLYSWQGRERKFIRYQFPTGLLNSSFQSDYFYQLHNGKWITATTTEIISFSPKQDSAPLLKIPEIAITGVSVSNIPLDIGSMLLTNEPLHLTYQQNFITVEFARLSYTSLHRAGYYYRLKGIDKDWIYTDTRLFASYTNLAPGKYLFDVKGEDDTGRLMAASLQFVIKPPFWKTWWFLLLVLICVTITVFQVALWRIKNIRAVEREKVKTQEAKIEMLSLQEKLSSAKLEALRSQMNPHFIFNCLNSIDNLIQAGEKEKATTYLAKFARLMRSILESSNVDTVPCWKDMETMKMYLELEELRYDKKFRYHLHMSAEIMEGDYKVPPLIIQPFIENAIHHGLLNKREPDKELIIHVSATQNYIQYIIKDNGVGRVKAEEYKQLNKPLHHSMGLKITIDRIHFFNQTGDNAVIITDLYDDRQRPAGTKVDVNIINQS